MISATCASRSNSSPLQGQIAMTASSDDALGPREEDFDNCALPLVRRVHALLGQDDTKVRTGDPLPRGWHFVLFTPTTPQTELGPDGAALKKGVSVEPLGMPRRMMGGRRITFFSDIPIGADVRRISEVVSAIPKSGKSGRFMIMTTRQLIYVGDEKTPALQEDNDTLFREPASASAGTRDAGPEPERPADHREQAAIDPTMLFRYSACTFNAHRIHYDHPYTIGTEGYPALVVNAGLTVLLLREFAHRLGHAPRAGMSTRNVRPIFCGTTINLCARSGPDGFQVWAEDEQRRVCAEVGIR
jgi:3-methylfumaryl-CoA hydratase